MVTWPNITGFLQDQSDDDLDNGDRDEHQEGVGPELPGQLQQSTPLARRCQVELVHEIHWQFSLPKSVHIFTP